MTSGPAEREIVEEAAIDEEMPRLRDLSLVVHVAVPEAGNSAPGYHVQAFLTSGINWPDRRAQSERFVQ